MTLGVAEGASSTHLNKGKIARARWTDGPPLARGRGGGLASWRCSDKMPISEEDLKRLPPMVPCSEVAETRRLEELKAFRRYLVDTGAVKSLVKLYQHTAKHEMRMDNPTLNKDFLATYAGENPGTAEAERLEEENK